MDAAQFKNSIANATPPAGLSAAVEALWWDAKGDWTQAHYLVNELESPDAMAVHGYLHRKEGELGNAEYWYKRSGDSFRRPALEAEWIALVDGLMR
ncbi:MAG TPA: hypothetical protein VMQ60_04080 [Acidobacteriaceae bacterium]|jgi:hypothetical protein|nr:hypothetical protein [Acidobacteriaceae bacterium]